MPDQIQFNFSVEGDHHTALFDVVEFTGKEGISCPYDFTIDVLCNDANLDIDRILNQPACLTLSHGQDTQHFQGILAEFDCIHQIDNRFLYRARLLPRVWLLSLYRINEVYLNLTVPEVISHVLEEAGFDTQDYDISSLMQPGKEDLYKKWPYKCQFNETHLDYLSRLMERDGIYYFFEQTDAGEKLIFCDDVWKQTALPNAQVYYAASASQDINQLQDVVTNLEYKTQRLPRRVVLKDYNDEKPSLVIQGQADVDTHALKNSDMYQWGQNIDSTEEAQILAELRAQQLLSTRQQYHGCGSVLRLKPGYFFHLNGHYRTDCNQEYQILSIQHQGKNPAFHRDMAANEVYQNQFVAITSDIQYRPPLLTAVPEIKGMLNALVDAEGDGQYAEVDNEGRYRIRLPFDRADRDGGQASHWLRLSQTFAGENQGMHFPLRKGAEVLLSHIGGDPDRPFIAGTLPNAGAPSVVHSTNQTTSVINTAANNNVTMEDQAGKESIKLSTPKSNSSFQLGDSGTTTGATLISQGTYRQEISGGVYRSRMTAPAAKQRAEKQRTVLNK